MKIFVLIAVLLGSASVFSQSRMDEGLKVNGLALGATREEVIKKLGKPVSQKKDRADECVGGTEMTLDYPGLKFQLWDDSENPRKFTVGSFEVTSSKWDVSGAKVGEKSTAIEKLFGKPQDDDQENGSRKWHYHMDEEKSPGSTVFTFRDGKVVSISVFWLMC